MFMILNKALRGFNKVIMNRNKRIKKKYKIHKKHKLAKKALKQKEIEASLAI